jgi:RimJ/RimL family protein N-acetyltransferase
VPDVTLEAISRTFYAEAVKYGFKHLDYVRFVNLILDHAMQQFSQRSNGRRVKDIAGIDDSMAHSATQVPPGLPLHGDRVTVRAFHGEPDIQHLELWTRDGLGKRFLLSRTSSQQAALRDVVKESSSVFGIIQARTGEPIGCVTFLNYDGAQRKAELRKLIGSPAHRGQGLAREASALWIQYGIQALGLKKIYLNTFETDIRNIRLNERLGFKVEGILRGEVVVNDVRRDVLRMGLVVDDLIGDEGTEI